MNTLNINNEYNYLFSGSTDKKILVWNFKKSFQLIHKLIGHEGSINTLKSFNNILASASSEKTIQIWSFSFKQLMHYVPT